MVVNASADGELSFQRIPQQCILVDPCGELAEKSLPMLKALLQSDCVHSQLT
ncbi:MAG: hypothetical protein RL081_1095 [Pseudomonadota bacterium]